MLDVFVRRVELPYTIEGVTTPNDDSTYDVYINSLLCPCKQQEALKHELNHIKKNHLYSDVPVVINEIEANEL